MYALYDDNGDFKVGTILAEAESSLQIESQHGKRQKVKASHVLLRFREPAPAELLPRAQAIADGIDIDFLWEASGTDEFAFESMAREYYGHPPSPVEATGILLRLHSAPVYFHRKGRGRYRAAQEETLRAALAGLEKRRQLNERIAAWAERLERGEFPDELAPLRDELLYKPDRNRPEMKAIEQACAATGLSVPRLFERCGVLPPSREFHIGRFLFEHFPNGAGFPAQIEFTRPADLPLATAHAFSLDDVETTEIDDAFSLAEAADGSLELGIHIAAPALGFSPESTAGRIARERLSTVYMPGEKITMLPGSIIDYFSLTRGEARPAMSLYVRLDPDSLEVRGTHSRIEAVPVFANLRHHEIEHFNAVLAAGGAPEEGPLGGALQTLFRFAQKLEAARGQAGPTSERPEYVFRVENDRVSVVERRRGEPLDKLVAEMMILVNRTWGKLLADHEVAAIYRAQGQGKVRMTTAPSGHAGLGVEFYAWSSSPLRRYVDLLNQWQLCALLSGESAPFDRNSASLLAAVRDFELTYASYGEFQDRMEHYWCLRWLQQEGRSAVAATCVRENVVKFRDLPLYVRIPSLPDLSPGTNVVLEIEDIDLIDSAVRAVYKSTSASKAT